MVFDKNTPNSGAPRSAQLSAGHRLRAATDTGNARRNKKSRRAPKFYWGFLAVVCCTLTLAACLVCIAWDRASAIAWGGPVDSNTIAVDGFILVDMSTADHEQRAAILSAALGAAAPSTAESADTAPALITVTVTPAEPESASEPIEDFGPLPKELSGYEDIILTVMDAPIVADAANNGRSESGDATVETPAGFILTEVGPAWREHVVKSGETLSDIAHSYGSLTAQDILRANGLKDANRLAENQLLLIPNNSNLVDETLSEVRLRQARLAAAREKVEPLKISAYVVVQGDSLWSISNSQNIELDTLVGSNTFKNSTLRPGTVLRIPNQEGIFYTLQKGEKLEDVCKRYEVDINRLKKVNVTVDVSKLKAGDEIFLPEARPEAVTETKKAEAKPASTSTASPASKPVSGTTGKAAKITSSRSFKWPVMGRINSPFGWRRHPITRRSSFHTGIDIQASMGTTIRAAREGSVVYSGWMGGYGKVIVIEHNNGLSTLYAHCSALLVGKGANVTQGQNICRVGMTGTATGPHLHFEVRNGNSPVNPLQYLK